MTELLSEAEIVTMREAGKVAASILEHIGTIIRPGITTKDIEYTFDERLSTYNGMESAFKGFMGYPASLCVSVNDEIIHGIPSLRQLHDGDDVGVDLGIKYKGLFVDTAYTYVVGKAVAATKKIVDTARKALYEGIKAVKVGGRVGDIGFAVQQFVEKNGFSVIRRFVGHGIGKNLHLYPEIPNFGEIGEGPELQEGMAIAIEPMIVAGSFEVEIANDGWTARTQDGLLSAHFEHTVAVTKKGPLILTAL
ncbi:MAG: type I methionyl aminopeptidase [Candidatus Omnitrophota bacterium]